MVVLQIHSEVNVHNFVRMCSYLAFLSYVIQGVTFFPDTVHITSIDTEEWQTPDTTFYYHSFTLDNTSDQLFLNL